MRIIGIGRVVERIAGGGVDDVGVAAGIGWPGRRIRRIDRGVREVRQSRASRNVGGVAVRTDHCSAVGLTGDNIARKEQRNHVGTVEHAVAIDITVDNDRRVRVGHGGVDERDATIVGDVVGPDDRVAGHNLGAIGNIGVEPIGRLLDIDRRVTEAGHDRHVVRADLQLQAGGSGTEVVGPDITAGGAHGGECHFDESGLALEQGAQIEVDCRHLSRSGRARVGSGGRSESGRDCGTTSRSVAPGGAAVSNCWVTADRGWIVGRVQHRRTRSGGRHKLDCAAER